MNLTIDLPDEQETALKAKAQAQGVSAEQYARHVLEHDLKPSRQRHISEVIRDNMRSVPAEVLEQLPEDGASQHDHYIYGLIRLAQERTVKAVFADTFYWIALTALTDAAQEPALQVTNDSVTTDEVLTEYLRRQAALNVHDILRDPSVRVFPQSRGSFLAGLDLYAARPDKGYSLATASRIVYRCIPCGKKD